MKTKSCIYFMPLSYLFLALLLIVPEISVGQRLGHSPARGGGNRAVSRPAPTPQDRSINGGSARPAPSYKTRPNNAQRPSNQQTRPAQRPSTNDRSRPNVDNRNQSRNINNNSRDIKTLSVPKCSLRIDNFFIE